MKDGILCGIAIAIVTASAYVYIQTPEWSREGGEMKRSEAIDYCKNLKEPGHCDHTDWRLPTSSELSAKELDKSKYWASDSADENPEAKMSVICVRNMPEKAEERFPKEPTPVSPETYDQTQQSPETSTAQPNEKKDENSKKSDKQKPVQAAKSASTAEKCVRTFPSLKDPNLTWCLATKKWSQKEAKQYCEAIRHDGKAGWRLPTSNELDKDLKPNYETYFPDSDYPPQRFWISGGKGLYWDRFGPAANGRLSEADCICVRKN